MRPSERTADLVTDAFRALARRHMPMIRAQARRMVGDPHLADDLTQSVLLALLHKADRLPVDAPLAPHSDHREQGELGF